MSDPIRDALIELVEAVNEQFFGNANNAIALSSRVITANSEAIRQLLRQAAMAAQPPAAALPSAMAGGDPTRVTTRTIEVTTRSIQDLRKWIIMEGQFGPRGTELLECLMHIDELRASQPSASNLEQTTLGIAGMFPPSDQEIKEWADQSDLIPDEELVCDEQWQRCFLPEQFYATIRAALARWGSPAAPADAQPPAPMAWPELPDCPEEWRTGDRADTEYVGGLRVGYRNARNKLAAMNPNHQPENHQ